MSPIRISNKDAGREQQRSGQGAGQGGMMVMVVRSPLVRGLARTGEGGRGGAKLYVLCSRSTWTGSAAPSVWRHATAAGARVPVAGVPLDARAPPTFTTLRAWRAWRQQRRSVPSKDRRASCTRTQGQALSDDSSLHDEARAKCHCARPFFNRSPAFLPRVNRRGRHPS